MSVGRPCLSEDDVLALLGGDAGTDRAAIEVHLDGCEDCRGVVAALAATRPGRADAGPTFTAGEEIAGRYRIVRFIAAGGMGEVYEAEDLALGEAVALKTVSAAISDDPALVARLKREVQLARKVSHENVCRIFDWTTHRRGDDELALLTMELLVGETLEARLARHGPLPARDALPLLAQIAAGLDAAHRAGVVHRDLKPGNVFLSPGRVVITDFGLARRPATGGDRTLALGSASRSILTRGPIGTPRYMAPEQARGDAVTAAADLYSFGLVMMETVAAPDARWSAAIARCLDGDPAARPAGAGEVIRALAPPRRRRAAITGALLAALAAIATVGFARGHRGGSGSLWCGLRSVDPGDVYVDAGAAPSGTGTFTCPYRTITEALDAGPGLDRAARIHVGRGTYDAALGERFPLVVRGAIAIEGAGAGVTRVVGSGTYDTTRTSAFGGPQPLTFVIGDERAATELARMSIASGATTATVGGYGVFCDRGDLAGVDDDREHTPSTILRELDVGPAYDVGVVVGADFDGSGCNLRVDRSRFHEARVGIWAVGCGANGDIPARIAVGLEVEGSTFVALRADEEPGGVGINVWDCTRWLNVRTSEFADSGIGVAAVNHAPTLTRTIIEYNRFHDLGGVGIAIGRAARVDRLLGNSFDHISAGAAASVAARGIGLLLDGATEVDAYPQIALARANTFYDNDVGIELRGATPVLGTLDFGRPDDPGHNVFRCNATTSGAAVAGHDLVVRAPIGRGARLALAGNTWDHDPPSRGAAPNGADLDLETGAIAIDTTGAVADHQHCSLRVP